MRKSASENGVADFPGARDVRRRGRTDFLRVCEKVSQSGGISKDFDEYDAPNSAVDALPVKKLRIPRGASLGPCPPHAHVLGRFSENGRRADLRSTHGCENVGPDLVCRLSSPPLSLS